MLISQTPKYPTRPTWTFSFAFFCRIHTTNHAHMLQQMKQYKHKKHLKNVGPIRYCEPPLHFQSPGVASRTPAIAIAQAACNVHNDDDNDNAWQRGPLWPYGMSPITATIMSEWVRNGKVGSIQCSWQCASLVRQNLCSLGMAVDVGCAVHRIFHHLDSQTVFDGQFRKPSIWLLFSWYYSTI